MSLIPEKLTRFMGRTMLSAKAGSPNFFFAAGIVGVVGGTYLACKATLKLTQKLENFQKEVEEIKSSPERPTYREDLVYVYSKNTFELAKLYAPAAAVTGVALICLTGSHVQLTRRNAALTAAYALVSTAYENYRERVRSVVGEERELDIYHATKKELTSEGEPEVKVSDPNKWSPYARFFDESSRMWDKDPEMNRMYVTCQQNWANNILQSRGHIFLNEVYEMLGLPHSKAGAVVGWYLNKDGDNYIDFGMYSAKNAHFVNGWERSILLDFNVDGVIFDKIKEW